MFEVTYVVQESDRNKKNFIRRTSSTLDRDSSGKTIAFFNFSSRRIEKTANTNRSATCTICLSCSGPLCPRPMPIFARYIPGVTNQLRISTVAHSTVRTRCVHRCWVCLFCGALNASGDISVTAIVANRKRGPSPLCRRAERRCLFTYYPVNGFARVVQDGTVG